MLPGIEKLYDDIMNCLKETSNTTFGATWNRETAVMNDELGKIVNWLHVNRLSLNVSKTHFMIFRRKALICDRNLSINNVNINQVDKTNGRLQERLVRLTLRTG